MDKYLQIPSSTSKENENPGEKRKREAVSAVWNFFKRTRDTNIAICKLCGKTYKSSGNTTNLMDHLNRIHPEAKADGKPNKRVTISIVNPLICELHKRLNEIQCLEQQDAMAALNYVKERLPTRLFQYETSTITRIATIIDPRFKKDGFLSALNAEQASKAVEEELSIEISKLKQTPQPTPPTTTPLRCDRTGSKGGGVAVIVSKNVKHKQISNMNTHLIENGI
ncbi:uncharacterized protein LOC124460792 [Drosophila willistoni]|uniref:uncharacterized protein LOC124460792 n=1 Tax=Drosophila willistoni TaxID=7260 RepID=UPI001F07E0BE|nr:uncharacterized protein LOC124460792 [Drosophila willistoni]